MMKNLLTVACVLALNLAFGQQEHAPGRDNFITEVLHKQKSTAAIEKSYRELVKRWPREKFPNSTMTYDYALNFVTTKFAEAGEFEKALRYLGQLEERFWRAQAYIPVAEKLLRAGDTATALPLIQTAIEDAEYYIRIPEDQKTNKARFAAVGYPGYVAQMAAIYEHQGRHAESLSLIETAIQLVPDQVSRFSTTYYKGLERAGRKLEALQQLQILYEGGNFSYKDQIKALYISLNGSDTNFENYIENLNQRTIESIRTHIATAATYKDAPSFELVNLQGEKVSLADMKGKVVVIDFWATWCQPCIRSFPGMLAAQEHYQQDSDVQFLFINTWERTTEYKKEVAAFIDKNNYPFEVLFDDQTENGQNLAARFGVQGIPAKYVLDGDGKIRYSLMGSNGGTDYTKLEMIELIEASKKPYKG